MPWALVQAGTKIYGMGTDGSRTEITLPSNVTLDVTRKLRGAILNGILLMVNSPTTNLALDGGSTTARTLVPRAPVSPPTLAAGASTGLTGVYKVRYTYGIKDRYGRIIAESPMSPEATITLANTGLAVSVLVPSVETSVNFRGIYRTTTGGSVYFRWADLDDNVVTSYDNNLADAGLSLLPQLNSSLGLPPGSSGGIRMKLIAMWKDRLWGVSTSPTDWANLRYSESLQPWAWPAANFTPIPPVGASPEGIAALMPRRDDFAIFTRNSVHKMTGDGPFQRITITEGAGLIAPDSVQVIHNVGYGLGVDGIYQYDDDGFRCISTEDVAEWFQSDLYFNRARFPYAEGRWNPTLNTYELHLSSVGSTTLDRWVAYDLNNKKFLGPHTTAAFTPTCTAVVLDAAGTPIPLMGGNNGFVYTMNRTQRTDDLGTAIDFDLETVHTCNTPDIEKQFLQMDVLSQVETSGTLSVTPTTITIDPVTKKPIETVQAAIPYDLTQGRERGTYIGPSRVLKLRWREHTAGQDVVIYGAELPFFELGRK